jgi:hypothetical protein
MAFSANQTKQSLLKKGFKIDNRHHHYYTYYYEGKMVARTRLSHNDQEIHDGLISKMRRQCQISKEEFINLIKCPLDEKGYIEILKKQGIIKI